MALRIYSLVPYFFINNSMNTFNGSFEKFFLAVFLSKNLCKKIKVGEGNDRSIKGIEKLWRFKSS